MIKARKLPTRTKSSRQDERRGAEGVRKPRFGRAVCALGDGAEGVSGSGRVRRTARQRWRRIAVGLGWNEERPALGWEHPDARRPHAGNCEQLRQVSCQPMGPTPFLAGRTSADRLPANLGELPEDFEKTPIAWTDPFTCIRNSPVSCLQFCKCRNPTRIASPPLYR